MLHDAIDNAEHDIKERFGAITTIHMDPIEADNSEIAQIRAAVAEKILEIDPIITIHDFRMVPGATHTNVIFDAVVPQNYKLSDSELAEQIKELVHTTWPDRFAVVEIDHSYI